MKRAEQRQAMGEGREEGRRGGSERRVREEAVGSGLGESLQKLGVGLAPCPIPEGGSWRVDREQGQSRPSTVGGWLQVCSFGVHSWKAQGWVLAEQRKEEALEDLGNMRKTRSCWKGQAMLDEVLDVECGEQGS